MRSSRVAHCLLPVALALIATSAAHASVRINSLNIISKVEIAKNQFEYVAQAKVQNTGPAVAELRATATSRDAATVILDAAVTANNVPSGNSAPVDTITFRGGPSAPNKLQWRVLTRTELALEGIARTGTPAFAGASVEATVSRDNSGTAATDWGRPNIETFAGGTTDINGRFSVPIAILAPTDFVTIRVTGPNGSVLAAIVGDASDIIAANGGRSNTTTDAQSSRLVISPFSTSAWALGLQALIDGLQTAGTRIVSEAQWRSLLQISDSFAILGRATYIKVLTENPALTRPTGFTNTFDFATRDSSAEAFRKSLQLEGPALFAPGLQDLLATLSVPYSTAAVPATLFVYQGDPKNSNTRIAAEQYDFRPDGTGSRQNWAETVPFTWQLDSAGRIEVTYLDSEPDANVALASVPPGYPCSAIAGQARIAVYDVADELTRMHDAGPTALLVNSSRRQRYEWLECPQFGPTIEEAPVRETSANVGVASLSNAGFNFAVSGRGFGAFFFLTGFGQFASQAGIGAGPPIEIAADILDFAADGTGRLRRYGTTFTWALNAQREMDLQFSNGDSMRMRHLATTSGIHSVWLTGTAASGLARLGVSALIPLDGSRIQPGTDGLTLRNGIAEEQNFFFTPPVGSQIDFVAKSDGTGCRLFVPDVGPTTFQSADWYLNGNRFEYKYGSTRRLGRYYEPLMYVPARSLNDLSTGGWITIENLQIVTPYDASTIPGRTQFLRNLGPAAPCSN
jgi:hypothetical protein